MAESTTEYTYTCGDKKGFEYYVLGDDIKAEFDFLKGSSTDLSSIAGNLDEMLNYLEKATSNSNAFHFDNGQSVRNLESLYSEIKNDVSVLKGNLSSLNSAILKDIDNVNAELDVNFGYWLGRKLARHESKKK